ncbi:NTP transferase domain-containing protein [Erythrobacter sp. NE805]|uniref:nucleotidyltransferase family protein n=1 Tax=Erythrobacter sp. NE805 TaxID=3389875 RepID=UPI00396B2B6A
MSLAGWSALILAGGAGQRFAGEGGGGKLLADLAGAPVIRRVAERVLGVGFAEVISVTGAADAPIRRALAGLDLSVSHAPAWSEGMAATLRSGIAALAPEAEGVCVFLGDMPLVPVELCPQLAEGVRRAGYAARPRVAGTPGHPVAFTRAAFADLLALQGDRGANALLAGRSDVAYLDTADRGALLDIDTPADLAAAARAWKA